MIETTTNKEAISKTEFDRVFQNVCNWGRWGADDERGTLNYITSGHVRAAAGLVRSGRTVSLSLPINTVAGPDNPRPAVHHMVGLYDIESKSGEPQFATDYLASEFHGDSRTHIDALCHAAYQGKLYNGKPVASVTSSGATIQAITAYAHGVVGRGVLLDIPRLRKTKWIEPGEAVSREELEEAEKSQGVRLEPGDIFLFRTGHHRRRLELGPWDNGYTGVGRAGLHINTIPMLHERQVAAFMPDGDGETVPSGIDGITYPIHALQIVAMGMACADSLQLEDLARVCEEEGRWQFMFIASPLLLPRGTGSIFNPIAIF